MTNDEQIAYLENISDKDALQSLLETSKSKAKKALEKKLKEPS